MIFFNFVIYFWPLGDPLEHMTSSTHKCTLLCMHGGNDRGFCIAIRPPGWCSCKSGYHGTLIVRGLKLSFFIRGFSPLQSHRIPCFHFMTFSVLLVPPLEHMSSYTQECTLTWMDDGNDRGFCFAIRPCGRCSCKSGYHGTLIVRGLRLSFFIGGPSPLHSHHIIHNDGENRSWEQGRKKTVVRVAKILCC